MAGRKPKVTGSGHRTKKEKSAYEEMTESLRTPSTMPCPKWLTKQGQQIFRKLKKQYNEMPGNPLCNLDITPLAVLANAMDIYIEAHKEFVEGGSQLTVTQISKGSEKEVINPLVKTMNEQAAIVAKLSDQLCLTPIGRMRMGVNASKTPKDEFLDIFNDPDENEDVDDG